MRDWWPSGSIRGSSKTSCYFVSFFYKILDSCCFFKQSQQQQRTSKQHSTSDTPQDRPPSLQGLDSMRLEEGEGGSEGTTVCSISVSCAT